MYDFSFFQRSSTIGYSSLFLKIRLKKIIGFDSFSGFPRYIKFDQLFCLKISKTY